MIRNQLAAFSRGHVRQSVSVNAVPGKDIDEFGVSHANKPRTHIVNSQRVKPSNCREA